VRPHQGDCRRFTPGFERRKRLPELHDGGVVAPGGGGADESFEQADGPVVEAVAVRCEPVGVDVRQQIAAVERNGLGGARRVAGEPLEVLDVEAQRQRGIELDGALVADEPVAPRRERARREVVEVAAQVGARLAIGDLGPEPGGEPVARDRRVAREQQKREQLERARGRAEAQGLPAVGERGLSEELNFERRLGATVRRRSRWYVGRVESPIAPGAIADAAISASRFLYHTRDGPNATSRAGTAAHAWIRSRRERVVPHRSPTGPAGRRRISKRGFVVILRLGGNVHGSARAPHPSSASTSPAPLGEGDAGAKRPRVPIGHWLTIAVVAMVGFAGSAALMVAASVVARSN